MTPTVIRFTCRCGKIHVVKAAFAGKTAVCKECGAKMTVPAAGLPETAPSPASPLPRAESPAPGASFISASDAICFQCRCGKTHVVKAAFAGKTAVCRHCGAKMTVPAASAPQAPPSPAPAAEPAPAAPLKDQVQTVSAVLAEELTEPPAPSPAAPAPAAPAAAAESETPGVAGALAQEIPAPPAPPEPAPVTAGEPARTGKAGRLKKILRAVERALFIYVANGDETYARAIRNSVIFHTTVILLSFVPMLWGYVRVVTPYRLPAGGQSGGGGPKMKQPVKRVEMKKRPRVLANPRSDIAFTFPEAMDVDVQLDKLTEKPFVGGSGDGTGTGLRVGAGKGKGGPGYGEGGEGGFIRFIRLQYEGGNWDNNFGLGADMNMLIEFSHRTGIPVADHTEHVTVRELMKFPKRLSPPFVYITGQQNIYMTDNEVKMLGQYLTERGGLLFADNGGGNFHDQFINVMRRVLPKLRFVEIPLDDEIFQQPYALPGAPPLWHHSGYRALGIWNQGRWIVFYHQGDIGDAWKDGHSGTSADAWEAAYKMGVNVIDYSARHYFEFTQKD